MTYVPNSRLILVGDYGDSVFGILLGAISGRSGGNLPGGLLAAAGIFLVLIFGPSVLPEVVTTQTRGQSPLQTSGAVYLSLFIALTVGTKQTKHFY